MNKLIVLVLATYFSLATCFASFEIYDFETKRYLTPEEFALQSNPSGFYILGEQHYNPSIQKTQSEIVELLVSYHQLGSRFDLAWEFMNFNDHESIRTDWGLLQNRNMTLDTFLAKYGQNNAGTYHPIFETLLSNNGYFYGVNAPRSIKQQIIKGGLSSVDPKWIPPRVEVGGDDYLERFKKAMGGHVDEDMLKSYFLAQCYADSVMAHHLNQLSQNDLSFFGCGIFSQ